MFFRPKTIPSGSACKKSTQLILIQQNLGSHELNGHVNFWSLHPKISQITYSFPEHAWLLPACKKLVHSTFTFLRYGQCQSPLTRRPHPFLTIPPKTTVWSTFNLYEHAEKSGYFIDMLWRYGWLKNSYNLIWWKHFDPYLMSQTFPKYRICVGAQQTI